MVNKADKIAAHEVLLYIENDSSLYNQMTLSIIKNLNAKLRKGTYDKKLALKAWQYLADEGVKRYNKEHGSGRLSLIGFDIPTRKLLAEMLQANYEEELENETKEQKRLIKNPIRKTSLKSKAEKVAIASQKLKHFTGKKTVKISALHAPDDDVLYALGKLKAVIYEAEIDGKVNDYIHKFASASQPFLATSYDGKHIHILGGKYEVTNRGIENMPKRRK